MILALVWKYDCEIVDVETAFLYGNLDEEIYMKLPEGIEVIMEEEEKGSEEECALLDRALYGLVQAARQFLRNSCRSWKGNSVLKDAWRIIVYLLEKQESEL